MNAVVAEAHGARWVSNYSALAELMYEVRRRCPRLEVLAISTLSPRHTPPVDQLELVETLFPNGPSTTSRAAQRGVLRGTPPSHAVLAWRWVRTLLSAIGEIVGLLGLRIRFRQALRRAGCERASVILKTWSFSPEAVNPQSDFYFGTLPHQLEARGVRCMLLCGDTRERLDPAFARSALGSAEVRTIPETLLIPFLAPLVTVLRQWSAAMALRHLALQHGASPLGMVCAAACRSSVQPITMRNALHFYTARSAVRRWGARVFVTLYEGQPWECAAWQGAKAADAHCVTVGYQHTVVMRHSLSVLAPGRIPGEASAPDVVLCLGELTRDMMARGHEPLGSRLVAFGSFRRPKRLVVALPQPSRRAILVVPETGVRREARLLFNFAIEAAALLPEYRFIFRCHPSMPFARLRGYLTSAPEAFPNIEVSEGRTIGDDFARASVVLYRGSSSVLYAVLYGLKPIYLQDAASPDVDPLATLSGWRDRVGSPDEMAQAVQRYHLCEETSWTEAWRAAVQYAEAYTAPVTDASIDQFLEAAGLANGTAPDPCAVAQRAQR